MVSFNFIVTFWLSIFWSQSYDWQKHKSVTILWLYIDRSKTYMCARQAFQERHLRDIVCAHPLWFQFANTTTKFKNIWYSNGTNVSLHWSFYLQHSSLQFKIIRSTKFFTSFITLEKQEWSWFQNLTNRPKKKGMKSKPLQKSNGQKTD